MITTLALALGVILDPLEGLIGLLEGFLPRGRWLRRADTSTRRRRGLAIVLGGVEGPSHFNGAMVRGLVKAGFRGSIIRFDWNAGPPVVRLFVNLISRRHHERRSDELVRMIVRHCNRHPNAPVHLLGQSGGCWIVVKALEKLPIGQNVQTAVLLAPAISRSYRFDRAENRCRHRLISVRAPADLFLLGLGTSVFGTSDRRRGPSAGWLGARYRGPRFRQESWSADWLRHGFLGNHTSGARARFIQHVVADWLRCEPRRPASLPRVARLLPSTASR